jgi:hypothetical protein
VGTIRKAFLPPATLDKAATGLTFTDILFGFVVQELFVRLANWSGLPAVVREQLVAGSILVLGSWIGYRRSRKRPEYSPKFFNLPLFMLVLDQIMVVFYFHVAALTPHPFGSHNVDPTHLAKGTTLALMIIFGLYAMWDLCGLAMSHSHKYENSSTTVGRLAITLAFVGAFVGLYVLPSYPSTTNGPQPASTTTTQIVLILASALLLAYRFAKDVASSLRAEPEPRPGVEPADEGA